MFCAVILIKILLLIKNKKKPLVTQRLYWF